MSILKEVENADVSMQNELVKEALNIIHNIKREGLGIDVNFSLPVARIVRNLEYVGAKLIE